MVILGMFGLGADGTNHPRRPLHLHCYPLRYLPCCNAQQAKQPQGLSFQPRFFTSSESLGDSVNKLLVKVSCPSGLPTSWLALILSPTPERELKAARQKKVFLTPKLLF